MDPNSPAPVNHAATLLKQATSQQQQGRLQEALATYRQALTVDPKNFDALHGAGMLYGQMARFEEALTCFTQAGAEQPNNFIAHFNRGVALQKLKRHDEALASYDRTLSLKPGYAEAHNNKGNVLKDLQRHEEALASYARAIALKPGYVNAYNNQGAVQIILQRYEEALASYDKALSLKPDYVEAYCNRATALEALKRFDEALAAYDKTLSLKPDHAEAYNNRGNILKNLRRYEEALSSYDKLALLKPDSAEAHHNRAIALEALKRFDEALAAYDKTLSLKPDYAEAHNNRGGVLKALQRYDEALSAYTKAIALNPDIAEIHSNRGNILIALQRYDEALASYTKAIALKPDFAEAHYHKGMLNLLLGNFEEGWRLHEWRWKTAQLKDFARNFKQPLWLGDQSIAGKTILLHSEQGLGDTIQFARYVPMVEALGATVILWVPDDLVSLFRTLKGNFTLIAEGDALPEFDLHCPLMSLPLAFGTTIDSIPAQIPYLAADPQKQLAWHERLGPKVKPRIGLVWSGNPDHINDRHRSMTLRILEPLLKEEYEFHSLQKELRAEDRVTMAEFVQILSHAQELRDFADTAALIAELDMVISIDTSVAHLAGAMGKPVWIVLSYVADYRWLTERSDSPWYPTARLFRQKRIGVWSSVIENAISELRTLV